MKHEKRLAIPVAAVLAFVTALGTVFCLQSAFSLEMEYAHAPILVCGCWALLSAVLFSIRRGGAAVLCLMALAWGYLYHDGEAFQQFWQLLHKLTVIYDRAYGWGVLKLPEYFSDAPYADWPLCILGAHIAIFTARCVCCRKSAWLPVLAVILPLCSCIVVTDTVPGEGWLLMVMAGLILLLLTSYVRQENAAQGIRLTATAALPVILALAGLFLALPQESYVNQSEILRENILLAAENFPQLMEQHAVQLISTLKKQPSRQVDLASLGPRIPFTYPIMEVTAEQSGMLYLRQQDYDHYDGLGWTATEGRTESFPGTTGQGEVITIRTRSPKAFCCLPYYPALDTTLVNGCAENPAEEQEYTILRNRLPENWRQTAIRNDAGTTGEWQTYLALPETTRQGIGTLLSGLLRSGASNTEKADIIAALVTDSARYHLNPDTMPAEEPDFALWFLREGESGYCVHFATTATVLLRAAGVPARYVTGYLLEARAGETVTVTEENAHAWAEYYEPNLGLWLPLEATPAEEQPAEDAPSRPSLPETTAPPESEPEFTEVPTEPDTAPTPSAPTASEPPLPPAQASAPDSRKGLTILLLLPVIAATLAFQRALRLHLRRRLQRTGVPNQQALYRWREAVRLSRLLKEAPAEELMALAQKAKFSHHELTAEELQQFDSFNRTCLRRLREKPWFRRLVYQYIFAAY